MFEYLTFDGEYDQIPAHMQSAIMRYIELGIKPGDFLTAVITNDLRNAVGYADATNLPLIPLYVRWFYNEAPSGCHGSTAEMKNWINTRRKAVAAE